MKIKSIAAICKKNKNIAIFERYSNDGDILTQYIGDGSAVYPVVGLPQLDKESLLTIFDVPEKDRDNYFVKTLGVPAGISFEDTDETERHVEREGISIIYSGRTLKPIRTTRGLVFCNPPYGREIGKWVQKAFEEARGGVSDCFTYPSADGYGIFSRLHLRESGNPLRARAATVHGRRRERRRSRALPFNGSYL